MSTWGEIPASIEQWRITHVESFQEWIDEGILPKMDKINKLKLLRGLLVKAQKLRTLTQTHFNANGWDTEQHGKEAVRLCDEMIDLATTIRNELT